ncbi:MAG: SemiSWEET transporter [Candidatus Omnitrophica bacterium]|nr:SemiSWEET transporter [Candidatus Omnitrophota bacterium]
MFPTLIGALAATLTMFSFIPQIVKSYKTRSVKDVSPLTLFQLALGVLLWIIYGIYIKDLVIIVANIITFISLAILIYMYFSFKNIKRSV